MRFIVNYKEREITVDVASWESTLNNRIEYYAVFADHEETFINFVKCTDQTVITEVSSSSNLAADIKAIIKEKLIGCLQHPY